jgi:hypothetical protein
MISFAHKVLLYEVTCELHVPGDDHVGVGTILFVQKPEDAPFTLEAAALRVKKHVEEHHANHAGQTLGVEVISVERLQHVDMMLHQSVLDALKLS